MTQINRHELANGLRLIHYKDTTTQMVCINTLYDVGARDEDPDQTGFAHLFEHLMFGGSINIPDFDGPLQLAGGENNAWTNNDYTNYYVTLPKQNVEIGFWLESDRMLSLDFSQKSLDVQKHVVIEEFKQRVLNQPYGDVPHLLKPLAYKSHSYMWPTIGKDLSHIENATLDDVKAFFYNHYAPNNAIVAVTGNIEFKEAVQLAEKWFGPIPRRDIKVRAIAQEAPQTEARFLEVYKDVPLDALFKAYHMCSRTDADFNACDMLSDVLANGRSARLYQNLVQNKQLCSEVNAYISGDIDPGVIYVTAKPTPGNTLETINAAIEEELAMLSQELVDNDELEKVKNKFESNHLFSHIHYSNMASSLCFYELVGKAEDIDTEVLRYRATTPEQVQATARKVFAPTNCSTLFYKANK